MDVRELVRVILSDYDAGETAVLQHREALRAAGRRLVAHDQLDDGRLELRDAITGEELFTGSIEEGMAGWDHSWVDVDTVDSEVDLRDSEVPGVPEGLTLAVRNWVESNLTLARDFAEGQ